jgi:hypothetical protein
MIIEMMDDDDDDDDDVSSSACSCSIFFEKDRENVPVQPIGTIATGWQEGTMFGSRNQIPLLIFGM